MKESSKVVRNVATGLIGFTVGFGLGHCSNSHDVDLSEKPYGFLSQKSSFPDYFYGRKITPEELHNSIRDAYFEGRIEGELVIKVLDGKISNIEPQLEKRKY